MRWLGTSTYGGASGVIVVMGVSINIYTYRPNSLNQRHPLPLLYVRDCYTRVYFCQNGVANHGGRQLNLQLSSKWQPYSGIGLQLVLKKGTYI
jgi:hypothetical protein